MSLVVSPAGVSRRVAACASLLIVMAASAIPMAGAGAQETSPSKVVERASLNRSKGVKGAPVYVYEFADFQCPFCASFAREVFPRIDSAYVKPGKVQWVFVNLPIPTHRNAWLAAEAAACAGGVADRFWEMHDRLYAHQDEWKDAENPTALLERYARDAGTPAGPFEACVARDQVAALILQDVLYGASARVTGTPTFIINDEQSVVGMKSFEEWKALLDGFLAKQK